ncbi:coiled-coil domain-containing protein 148-like isoform X3 [Limulus polyphemus]|uniref:Coiled-coil domain-containing protein 148-like isoform X3 n=1 Tax=Limulus polyphemus TaxID=6850 RepID=A0ABM1T946_LIMPO|nr:coiled-coil domain-containing protein 148-like isoform X3 [Limulus polyphemus]
MKMCSYWRFEISMIVIFFVINGIGKQRNMDQLGAPGPSRRDLQQAIPQPWEDLQDWLDRHELEKPLLPSTYMSHHQIQEILRTVWCDYFIMIQKLDNELEESERELQKASTIILEERGHQSSKSILEKYEELPFLSSPVHDKLLNQLHQLDLRYKIKIEDLGEKSLKDVCLTDTWRTSEKSVLYHILEQYPSGMLNKWTLCSDRLKRTFPEKSTKDLVTLTQLSESQQLYTKQRNAILNSWLQDRKKWQNKAVKEVCDAHNKFLVRKASKEAQVCQKAVCDQLRIKLEKMKEEKKMEKLKEEEKASKYQETMKKANKMTAMKEKQRREIEKEMLKSYFEEKLRMQNENQEDLCRLLQEMKVVRKQQMKYNRKRVQFRESVLSKKKSVQLNRKEAQKQQVEDKEKHLYALVSQVRAKVKKDPSRVLQHTAASLTRKYTNKCDPRPFKPFHSFTEEQILCDHRLRLEQLLRQADLINSKYGIAVMKQVQPFREPRKDMKSTVFEEI